MKKKTLTRAVIGACLLQLAGLPAAHAADDWTPQLLPAKGARGPVEPFRIRLPNLPAAVLERLTLELDDFDVTALVTRDGADAVFTPPQPLPYGAHQLRLVEYAADGAVIERGAWDIEIRKSTAFREGELRIGSTLNVVQRIADDDLPANAPRKTQANGAAQIYSNVADDGWRVQSTADLLYNTQAELNARGRGEVDVGRWLVRGDAGPATAAAGHQVVAPDSLVMQAFNRRGVSLGVWADDPTKVISTRAFRLHTQDIIGFESGLGVGDEHNHVDGATLSLRPISSARDALTLTTTYVTGEGPAQTGAAGTGIVGTAFETEGSAANFVADSQLLAKRLRLRGEYAVSNYDFDGLDTGSDKEKDNAWSALATYVPLQNVNANGAPVTVQFGVEEKQIGTFFKSIANPIGLGDRQGTRGFTGLNWGGFNANASYGVESDNVNDLALLPRTETIQSVLSLTYVPTLTFAPRANPAEPPAYPWHGQPMFNLTYINLDQDVTKAAAGLAGGALHSTTSLSATASFTYSALMWSANHTVGSDEHFGTLRIDTRSHLTQLSLSTRIGDKLTLSPAVQWSKIENNAQANKDSATVTSIFNVGYAFTQRVNLNLGYSANRQQIDDGTINSHAHDIFGTLNWIVTPPQGVRPGFSLALEGQYHDVDDRANTVNSVNNYQIFLKGSLSWIPIF
jgi:hypothetical protein